MSTSVHIGVDAGGTLVKVAVSENGRRTLKAYPASSLPEVAASLLQKFPKAQFALTGGKASLLQSYIGDNVLRVVEFDATCLGVRLLMQEQNMPPESFVLTNVGTGTSIHHVEPHGHRRVGGIGVGGGTIMGLSFLLTGLSDYEDIVLTALDGDRSKIDLTVSHIYEGSTPPIPGNLTASNFGRILQKPAELTAADKLASVIGLVGESVSTVSVHAAGQVHVSFVVYIGSSFIRNSLLRDTVVYYTELRGGSPLFLQQGEFSGAIGAMLSL